ncbi:MAG: HAD family phosphatase [Bacilli bacterium]|nr:HAD family phosphatase [Bacilli bacterium]
MIKNIVFDIGNVILNFNYKEVLNEYTSDEEQQKFIENNIINSPEWLGYALIDTGYITKEEAISIVQDRTNHTNDLLIEDFWNTYNNYGYVDNRVLDLIKKLKEQKYNVYLLSNINAHTVDAIKSSGIFDIVDGYVLSYIEHQVKPYVSIYKTLINRYDLNEKECLFIDDNVNNVRTANELGMIGKLVEPDNYSSVLSIISEVINKGVDLSV